MIDLLANTGLGSCLIIILGGCAIIAMLLRCDR